MIFVTVGSWGFDALVQAVDEYAVNSSEEIVIQIANSSYIPKNCEYFKTTPSLDTYYSRADLIIAHGGTGTTLEVLSLNKPLLSVANPMVKDNHQAEFLEKLEQLGALYYLLDLSQLDDAIQSAYIKHTKSFNMNYLWGALTDDLALQRPILPSKLHRFLSNKLSSWTIAKIPSVEITLNK